MMELYGVEYSRLLEQAVNQPNEALETIQRVTLDPTQRVLDQILCNRLVRSDREWAKTTISKQSSYLLDGCHSGALLLCKLSAKITKPTQERQLSLVRLASTRKPCRHPMALNESLKWWEMHLRRG